MVTCREFFYPSVDGRTNIHTVVWQGEKAPRAVVQIAHGICEYIERYDHFAHWLAERGFVVVGNDHLGHGESWQEPERMGLFSETDGWNKVVQDVERLQSRMAAEYPGLPYFLLGHSMGSFVARTFLIQYPGRVTGALISGTAQQPDGLLKAGYALCSLLIRLKGTDYRSSFMKSMLFGPYNKAFRPNRTECDWVCSDTEVVDTYCQDPGCQFLPTVSLYQDMLGGLLFIGDRENLTLMDKETPAFFFAGALDPVGEQGKGVERAYQGFVQAGCTDVQCKLYPNGRHEVLNEVFKEQVWQDVLDWMETRI